MESSHAIAYAMKLAPKLPRSQVIVVNLSGRGDKDIFILAKYLGDKKFFDFLSNYVEQHGKR